jgi:hypothetical protein
VSTPIVPKKAGDLDIEIEKYASFTQLLHFKDKLTGDPIDYTGSTFRMQIRENIKATTVLMELTTANTRIVSTDLANGDITLVLSASDTATFTIAGAVYDLLVDLPTAKVDRILEGQVHIHDGSTRP